MVAYYNVWEGMSSSGPSQNIGFDTTTKMYTYSFCPGDDICPEDFAWNWRDAAVWKAVDDITGSCMYLEVQLLQWLLAPLWVTFTFLMAATTCILAYPRSISKKLLCLCACMNCLSVCGTVMIVVYIYLCSDVFNSGKCIRKDTHPYLVWSSK